MVTIKANRDKQRLYITFSGTINTKEAEGSLLQLVEEINKLNSGFDVITDFRGLKKVVNKSREVLRNSMDYLSMRKVRRVIRVVGGAKAMLMKFADFTQGFKGYKATYVPTLEEAERKLDGR